MNTFKRINTDPFFTEKLEIDGDKYTLINSGTKHTGLYSIRRSYKIISKEKATMWMYNHEYDKAFDFFPELEEISDKAQTLTHLTNIQYDMFVESSVCGDDTSVYEKYK